MNNIACRIFKEQFDLIQALPENLRKEVLYLAIQRAFNQYKNQNENQNENAYISVSVSDSVSDSVSVIADSILNLLSKSIVCKKFSNNYGGKRENAGRKPRKQLENAAPTLKEVLEYAKSQNEMAGCGGFKCEEYTAKDFWSYYDKIGWVAGEYEHPIRNWKSALKQWVIRNERSQNKPKSEPIAKLRII